MIFIEIEKPVLSILITGFFIMLKNKLLIDPNYEILIN